MRPIDFHAMRPLRGAQRDTARLAARISKSLGQPPRRIPSRTALAIESLASMLAVTATIVSIAAIGTMLIVRKPAPTITTMISTAIDGRLPPAHEVYTLMTGLEAEDAAQP